MRSLRQFCAASILVLVLAFSAFAGEMSTPGITAPPPPPDHSLAGGLIETPGVTSCETSNSETATIDSVRELALHLFDGMMSSIF
jgi:hypothetical protein